MLHVEGGSRGHTLHSYIVQTWQRLNCTIYGRSTLGNSIGSGSGVHMRTYIIHGKLQVVDMVMLILSSGSILLCCLKRQELLDESVYASRCVSYL